MPQPALYAIPREVSDRKECQFYHTMEIPGSGLVTGAFDLRKNLRKSLGGLDFKGKRVLEMGTADGFLCFSMERLGAEVVAYDLSADYPWDIVPYAGKDAALLDADRREHIRKINNAFWFSHAAFKSKAKMVYGTVYGVPKEIGQVDIATFGAILLHVRDPFLALQNVLQLTRETVIISEPLWGFQLPLQLLSKFIGPFITFVPNSGRGEPDDTWWFLSIALLREYLAILGFEKTRISYFYQLFNGKRLLHYALVADRTVPLKET